VLRDTTLPPAKDGDTAALGRLFPGAGDKAGDDRRRELLRRVAGRMAQSPVPDDEVAPALLAVRALRGLGKADGAVELLRAVARTVRRRPEGTFFAL
jgi:hypothetical protein